MTAWNIFYPISDNNQEKAKWNFFFKNNALNLFLEVFLFIDITNTVEIIAPIFTILCSLQNLYFLFYGFLCIPNSIKYSFFIFRIVITSLICWELAMGQGNMLSNFDVLSHLLFIRTVWGSYYYNHHFIDGHIET